MSDKKKAQNSLPGVSLPDYPAPGPKAGNLPNRTWSVFAVDSKISTSTGEPGQPSSGGVGRRLFHLGNVEARDLSEAQGRAAMRWGEDKIDYHEPKGYFPKEKTGEN
jgi:hypothetical protein